MSRLRDVSPRNVSRVANRKIARTGKDAMPITKDSLLFGKLLQKYQYSCTGSNDLQLAFVFLKDMLNTFRALGSVKVDMRVSQIARLIDMFMDSSQMSSTHKLGVLFELARALDDIGLFELRANYVQTYYSSSLQSGRVRNEGYRKKVMDILDTSYHLVREKLEQASVQKIEPQIV